jgi:hypothetical protein
LSKYNNILYEGGYYGVASNQAYSVEPLYIEAVDYTQVDLTWQGSAGLYNAVRLVRNQDSFPETSEDGVILWEDFTAYNSETSSSAFKRTAFSDNGSVSSLVSGRFAYYRIWVRRNDDNLWYVAGSGYTLVPKDHGEESNDVPVQSIDGEDVNLPRVSFTTSHSKFMNYLPKVFTSVTQSPIDLVDTNSDLYRFLKGFSFTLDEFLTYSDLVLPDNSGSYTNPSLVELKTQQLGLAKEVDLSLKNQKKLIREANYMYSRKGTQTALGTYIEALTSFSPTITQSPNIMLTLQDSTFYKGLGFWRPVGNCTLTVANNILPYQDEQNSIDTQYVAKVVASSPDVYIKNGDLKPSTQGIPVNPGFSYDVSLYYLGDISLGDLILEVTWHNFTGAVLSTDTHTLLATVDPTTWKKDSVILTAPTDTSYADQAYYASLAIKSTVSQTFYLDMIQFKEESDDTNFYEARGIDVFLAPTKTNFIQNSSFADDDSNWTAFAYDVLTETAESIEIVVEPIDGTTNSHAFSGTNMATITSTTGPSDTTQLVTNIGQGVLDSSILYVWSIYGRTDSVDIDFNLVTKVISEENIIAVTMVDGVVIAEVMQPDFVKVGDTVTVTDIDSNFNGVVEVTAATQFTFSYSAPSIATITDQEYTEVEGSVTQTITSSKPITLTSDWTRNYATFSISSRFSKDNTSVTLMVESDTGATDGEVLNFDMAQLESGFTPTDYFDGDMPVGYSVYYQSPTVSISHMYVGRSIKRIRLLGTIREYLPTNTAYIIRSYAGVEGSGIS